MIKTYLASQTARITYNSGNSFLDLVSGNTYTLDDLIAKKFTNYLTETPGWKTIESNIAVNLTNVTKTYNIVNIQGNKSIDLILTPTGTIPTAMVLTATLKNTKGETIDTSTLTTSTTYTTATTFKFSLNRPFEIYDMSISVTFKAGTAYSVNITMNDPIDTNLENYLYKNGTNSWVQKITPVLS